MMNDSKNNERSMNQEADGTMYEAQGSMKQNGGTTFPPKRENEHKNLKLGLKALIILTISLLLLIPSAMMTRLVNERQDTEAKAEAEVATKWGGNQIVTGPILSVPTKKGGTPLYILPNNLKINGFIKTQTLRRGIYDLTVFNTPLEISGDFVLPQEISGKVDNLSLDNIMLILGIEDVRGLAEQVSITIGGVTRTLSPGANDNFYDQSGLSLRLNLLELTNGKPIPFKIKLLLRGSESLAFLPVGKTTNVTLQSDCLTPSFTGNYLPMDRTVNDKGFTANWKILDLNRDYPQAFKDNRWSQLANDSQFGVELLQPVMQYQKSTRAVKYAFFIIILTFTVVFFTEIIKKKQIHPIQYLLVGLSLCLFYTLLLSISEHLNFNWAYLIAAIMTIGMITAYLAGILKIKKTALCIGGLLTCLYAFIFVLIQMETYALLVGSIGLFAILGFIMYASQKINWYGQE